MTDRQWASVACAGFSILILIGLRIWHWRRARKDNARFRRRFDGGNFHAHTEACLPDCQMAGKGWA